MVCFDIQEVSPQEKKKAHENNDQEEYKIESIKNKFLIIFFYIMLFSITMYSFGCWYSLMKLLYLHDEQNSEHHWQQKFNEWKLWVGGEGIWYL
jgi:hypothetical protein